jgi:hypothetical protein
MLPSTLWPLLLEDNYSLLHLTSLRSMSLIFHTLRNRQDLKLQTEIEDLHPWEVVVAEVPLSMTRIPVKSGAS